MKTPSVSRQAYNLLVRKDDAGDGRGVVSVVRAYLVALASAQEPEIADGFRSILRRQATAAGPIVERDGALWLKVCELNHLQSSQRHAQP